VPLNLTRTRDTRPGRPSYAVVRRCIRQNNRRAIVPIDERLSGGEPGSSPVSYRIKRAPSRVRHPGFRTEETYSD
ncbi:MAG TPA: hypothetical protein VGB05_11360, partial [Pyrinomonadaceae bacterium]